MARSVILVHLASFLTAGVYAVRVANKNTGHESQAAVHASDFVPGQLVPGPRSAAMQGANTAIHWNTSMRFWDSPHISRGALAARMAMQEDPGYLPDLPNDWESAPDVWDEDWADEQFWDMKEQQWKTLDADGNWRDQKGGFTKAPDLTSLSSPTETSIVWWEDDQNGDPHDPANLNKLNDAVGSLSLLSPAAYWLSPGSDPASSGPVTKYTLNLAEAVASLNRDIPQALRFERDQQRVMPTNWNIYSDSLESDFKAVDSTAMGLLGTLIPSWKPNIKGLRSNQRVLQELRSLVATLRCSNILESDSVKVSTRVGVDHSTGEDVIFSRWSANLVIKRVQIPRWIPRLPFESILGSSRTEPQKPESIMSVEAVSRFYLDAQGKICRTSVDKLYLLVDGIVLETAELKRVLAIVAALPIPRLPLPPDNFDGREGPPLP